MKIEHLKINDVISNQQLSEIFKCSTQGGMRRSKKTNTLILISDHTKKLYNNRIKDGIIYYTGMGRVGDQALISHNKTLAESRTNGVTLHFFEVFQQGQYTYRGIVELVGEPFTEIQKDMNGEARTVWVFPLKKVDDWTEEVTKLEKELEAQKTITNTEKEQVVKSRIGQSTFKDHLLQRECKCAICGITDKNFLIASHIKPWSKSTHAERLDVNNGLLLCPNHDALFDKGYISFDDNGQIVISSKLNETTKKYMNINPSIKIKMSKEMKKYMKYHYENILMI